MENKSKIKIKSKRGLSRFYYLFIKKSYFRALFM